MRPAGITRARIGSHMLRHTFNVVARVRAKLDVATRAELLNHVGTQTLLTTTTSWRAKRKRRGTRCGRR